MSMTEYSMLMALQKETSNTSMSFRENINNQQSKPTEWLTRWQMRCIYRRHRRASNLQRLHAATSDMDRYV